MSEILATVCTSCSFFIHEDHSDLPPCPMLHIGRIQITGSIGRQARFANGTYELQEHAQRANDTQPTAVQRQTEQSPTTSQSAPIIAGLPWLLVGQPVSAFIPGAGSIQWSTVILDIKKSRRGGVRVTLKKPNNFDEDQPDFRGFSGERHDEIEIPLYTSQHRLRIIKREWGDKEDSGEDQTSDDDDAGDDHEVEGVPDHAVDNDRTRMPRYRKILFPGTQSPRPPAFHVFADPDDRTMTQDERANWLEKQEKRRDKFLLDRKIQETDPDYVLTPEELDKFPMIPPRVRGYVGKAKGMRQMAFECGAYVPGCKKATLMQYFKYRPDFVRETSELADSFTSRGNGFVLSVKCHPEMAGKGIEYCWGKSKYHFRRYTNTESPNYPILETNVRISMGAKKYVGIDGLTHRAPLPLSQVFTFATRARRYRNAYGCYTTKKEILDAAKDDDDNTTFGLIEKELKTSKRHRCTMDKSYVFVIGDS